MPGGPGASDSSTRPSMTELPKKEKKKKKKKNSHLTRQEPMDRAALDGFYGSLTDEDILAISEEWLPEISTDTTEETSTHKTDVSHLAPRVGVCPVEDGIPRTKCIRACAGPNVPSPHSTSLDS